MQSQHFTLQIAVKQLQSATTFNHIIALPTDDRQTDGRQNVPIA